MLPSVHAPNAAAPRGPAITRSIKPWSIQPSSATTSGHASCHMGRISLRTVVTLPRPGVSLVVYGHQIGQRNLGILLRGRKPCMPQQLLNRAQIGAIGEQVRGIGVPEAMRMERWVARQQRGVEL